MAEHRARPRVVKAADDRRAELLDVALQLFLTRGYERVAVQDITDAVRVAKGTFYHYFASKADLLAQVCERQTAALLAAAEPLVRDTPGDAAARLRAVIGLHVGLEAREPRDRRAVLARALRRREPGAAPATAALARRLRAASVGHRRRGLRPRAASPPPTRCRPRAR